MREPPADWTTAVKQLDPDDLARSAAQLVNDTSSRDRAVLLANDLVGSSKRQRDFTRKLVDDTFRSTAVGELALIFATSGTPLRPGDLALARNLRAELDHVVHLTFDHHFAEESTLADSLAASLDQATTEVLVQQLGKAIGNDDQSEDWFGERKYLWLSIVYRRLATYLLVAWACAESPTDSSSKRAIQALRGEAADVTRASLESPLYHLSVFIEDSTVRLVRDDEVYLRTQIETVRAQLRSEQQDRLIVERAIALIVGRLLTMGSASGAKRILIDLGAGPPDLVEDIAEALAALMLNLSRSFGLSDQAFAGDRIAQAGRSAKVLQDKVDTSLAGPFSAKSRPIRRPAWVTAETIAKGATQGVGVGLGKNAVDVLWREYHIGEIFLSLVRAVATFSNVWIE